MKTTRICGDINIEIFKNDDKLFQYKNLLDWMKKNFGLCFMNNLPSRVSSTTSTCIDHCLSQSETNVFTIENLGSDHRSRVLQVKECGQLPEKKSQSTELVSVVSRRKHRQILFCNLHLTPVVIVFHSNHRWLIRLYNQLHRYSTKQICLFTSINMKTRTNHWIPKECRKMLSRKQRFYKNWKANHKIENCNKYVKCPN